MKEAQQVERKLATLLLLSAPAADPSCQGGSEQSKALSEEDRKHARTNVEHQLQEQKDLNTAAQGSFPVNSGPKKVQLINKASSHNYKILKLQN